MISFKLKGSSILSMALASAVITASIAYSVSKMNHVIFNSSNTMQLRMQAEQYAKDRASILRSCNYGSLVSMDRREAGEAYLSSDNVVTLYEEVVENAGSDDSFKEFQVNIYKENEEDPITSVVVRRTNPGYLLDGQIVSEGSSETGTLTSENAKNVVTGRFSETDDSESTTNAMSAYSAIKYTQNTMTNYLLADESLKISSGSAVGNATNPVFVSPDGNVTRGKVSYRLSKNLDSSRIAVLVKENNTYYLDYLNKDDFFHN